MFDELPETNPRENPRKPRAFAAAVLIQAFLVSILVLVQMAMPQRFGRYGLLATSTAAAPPLLGQPAQNKDEQSRPNIEHKVEPRSTAPQPERFQPQETIPQGVTEGQLNGVQGGIGGGVPGGTGEAVRVGGNIREPQILRLVKPQYPPDAIKAQVQGDVVLEATITEKGDVAEVKVISGPPVLIPAAVKAVEEWKYEPTRIGGRPVAVILTATVHFSLRSTGK
jgi:protein TonB